MPDFGERLAATFASSGALCLGIDPHPFLLDSWGLDDTPDGVRELALRAVDAAEATIGIVKPQAAFFERHGSRGYAVLEEVVAAARAAGLLVIVDVKRGDVGSTVEAYGQAWLTPGSPLEVDAMTVVAYQGVGSLVAPIELARHWGKGLFILAATSNPEAFPIQTAVLAGGELAGRTVAASIVAEVDALNSTSTTLGSMGVVVGATVDRADYALGPGALTRTPILAPGFGEQGATVGDVRAIYGELAGNAVVNVGRSILRAGADGIQSRLRATADELAGALA